MWRVRDNLSAVNIINRRSAAVKFIDFSPVDFHESRVGRGAKTCLYARTNRRLRISPAAWSSVIVRASSSFEAVPKITGWIGHHCDNSRTSVLYNYSVREARISGITNQEDLKSNFPHISARARAQKKERKREREREESESSTVYFQERSIILYRA